MTAADLELVSFRAPPVEEVALAAQFADPVLSFEQLAQLDERLRSDFSIKQLHPELPRMTLQDVGLQFHLDPPASMPRIWWLASDGHYLVQAQGDRVALNWRRLGKPTTYPRYPSLRQQFENILSFVTDIVKADAQVDVCEVTYVNELSREDLEDAPALASFLTTVGRPQAAGFLPQAQEERWEARWNVPRTQDGFLGRLDVKAEPALNPRTERQVYLLTMTCRIGGPSQLPASSVVTPLDIAHEWIVRGFADLTTSEMHERWGRTR